MAARDVTPGIRSGSLIYRRIAVGLGGSIPSLGALRHADDLASRLGIGGIALRAWGPEVRYMRVLIGAADFRDGGLSEVGEAITRAFHNDPPARVTSAVREWDAASILIAACAPADLHDIGSRGHRGLAGPILWPVSD